MTDIERDTERRITALETNMNNLIAELRDFKTELRDRDNRRAAEIMEIRQRQDAAQAKHDAEMHEMNQWFYAKFDAIDAKFDKMDAKIDGIGNHVRNITVATIIGVATIAITVIYSIVTH